jgi:hypothetical protein
MKYTTILWRVEICSLKALFICSILAAVYGFIRYLTGLSHGMNETGIVFAATFAIGIIPVVAYGAPVYALLSQRRLASWPLVLVVGVSPGIFLLHHDTTYGTWLSVCGLITASITHILFKQFLSRGSGSNSRLEADAP